MGPTQPHWPSFHTGEAKIERRLVVKGAGRKADEMKVSIGMQGATPIVPDYSMLKAALVAAQAATPTGRANLVRPEEPVDPHAALHALFSSKSGIESSAAALGNRFHTDAPDPEAGDEER
jgi:hypothetical protein